MKKTVIGIIFLAFLFLMPFAVADTPEEIAKVQKAYQCVKDQTSSKTDLSLQEAIFSILAAGSSEKATKKLEDEKGQNCWPKSVCNLKETSQALLAYRTLGKDTKDIQTYIISKNASATGLNWFLVMDIPNRVQSSCTISYSGSQASISIGEDMKISGNPGTCLSVVSNGYWLQVSPSCLDYKFSISCDQDFVTTLLYQESGSDTIFLSSETKGAASSGQVEQSINAKCFRIGGECDYEGSLWATLALSQTGQSVTAFVPYLAATSSKHPDLFPESFLYKFTSGDEYYSAISQSQKNSQYWQAPNTIYNKFYDTSLALLALQGKTSNELTNAKSYLLGIQSASGCWNNDNLRDTAFLLYAGWPSQQLIIGGGGGGGNGTNNPLCSSAGYSCVSSIYECTTAQGTIKADYSCSGALYCCTAAPAQQTCTQKGGRICSTGQTCSGLTQNALDGSCCMGTCTTQQQTTSACEAAGGGCYPSCTSTEQTSTESCSDSSLLCCIAKSTSSSPSSISWVVWVLILLVILVALAIVFRNKLRAFLFRMRRPGSMSSSPIMARRPPFPPSTLGSFRPAPPRQFSPQPTRLATRPQASVKSKSDSEMEETLRKLKELSK